MISVVHRFIVPAAYAVLPERMQSLQATAMLLAIGLQESEFEARRQHAGGPARGFWQFEKNGGMKGVATHDDTRDLLTDAIDRLRYPRGLSLTAQHAMLEHNDVFACVCARLLLWTLPRILPQADQPSQGWHQYLDAWRPGKPHPDTWERNYGRAWTMVADAEQRTVEE